MRRYPVIEDRPVVAFTLIGFALSWSVWIGGSILFEGGLESGLSQIWTIPAVWGLVVAAAVVVSASGESLRKWATKAVKWRVAPRWYLIALFVPIGIKGVTATLLGVLGVATWVSPPAFGNLVFEFLLVMFLAGGLEEFGWRGFAVPRLQREHTAFASSVVVGVIWATWHVPVFLLRASGSYIPFVFTAVRIVAFAVFLSWIYNGSKESVLVCMIAHTSYNTLNFFATGASVNLPAGGTMNLLQFMEPVVWLIVVLGLLGVYGRELLSSSAQVTG